MKVAFSLASWFCVMVVCHARPQAPSAQYGPPSATYGVPGAGGAGGAGGGAPAGGNAGVSGAALGGGGGGGSGGDEGVTEEANYSFAYEVKDAESGNDFGHMETRMGHVAMGSYHVQLPDGRMQKVEYTADQDGYKPVVTYEGEAQYGPGVGGGKVGGGGAGGGGGVGGEAGGYRYR